MPYLLSKTIPNSKMRMLKGGPTEKKNKQCLSFTKKYKNHKGSLLKLERCESTTSVYSYINILFPNKDLKNNIIFMEPIFITKLKQTNYPIVVLEVPMYKYDSSSHSNLFVIDKENNKLTRFEPNGSGSDEDEETAFLELSRYIAQELGVDFTYESTIHCMNVNFSLPKKQGVCDYITLFVFHFKLLYPDYSLEQIQDVIMKHKNFKLVLTKYLSYVNTVMEEVEYSSEHINAWK
jgi:hypothetical protein